ncbi:PIN domain-containing protein [Glycomyces buryatensis]|uniref:PIN domain-containing protein n=1 Tax=Glycomyces buryatensis TaxID=2570927 RepID=A0A4S8QJK5_9ACTN|nr:PIN domain-containing protein [Glycomyces buryatensis]THV43185.1 PIN domain-containing protein [Glycomyces buryatensis]
MPLRVLYDANVLYPNTLRDLLIRLAQADLAQARWSERILDEMQRAISRQRPDIATAKLAVLRDRMNGAIRDCRVEGFEPLIDGLKLPDVDDRHVLAAAIACRADAIVTFNLGDFPSDALAPWGIEAWSPDEFLLDLIDLDAKRVWACLQRIADSRRNPPETIEDVLAQLERSGLIEAAAELRVG